MLVQTAEDLLLLEGRELPSTELNGRHIALRTQRLRSRYLTVEKFQAIVLEQDLGLQLFDF